MKPIVHVMPAPPAPEFLALQAAVAGRYSLECELGRGGMGIVFLARDVALDRLVAIKLLPPALAANPVSRERFLREARTAAKLSHPNIVPIHAVEEYGALVIFVMGYVDGETLGARVRRTGPLPAAEAMRIMQEAAWALGHAHSHGVVHRDVKPDNILLERGTGRAVVADFGIARAAAAGDTPAAGRLLGTPQYMSPEQASGGPVDGRSDLYSLGITAFYALTGRLPFEAQTVAGLIAKHAAEPAPRLDVARPTLPRRFSAALERCLAKHPAARFASAEELAEEIRTARGGVIEIPAPIRAFLREIEGAGAEIDTALTVAGTAAAALIGIYGFDDLLAGVILISLPGLMIMLAGVRFGQVVLGARELLRDGYGHSALRPALVLEERARAEEAESRPQLTKAIWLRLGVGAAKLGLGIWLLASGLLESLPVLELLVLVGVIALPAVVLRQVTTLTRRGRGLWHRLLRGRFGRWVFTLAGVGLGDRPALAPVAGEPTGVVLGNAAEQLLKALPLEQRRRLVGASGLIERLQAHALARDGRATTAVVALETLRLDLLRLQAGTGTLDELTRDLEDARRLGERIDAELEKRDDVS